MFKKKGYIVIDASKADEDSLMNLAIEAGADDFQNDGETYEIYTTPESFDPVLEALKKKGVETMSAEISMIPETQIKLEGKAAQSVVKLMELMEEHDDVQHVYANFDIEEDELASATS
jgi:transcriptional/translational regulatory protein YebC/TACO1